MLRVRHVDLQLLNDRAVEVVLFVQVDDDEEPLADRERFKRFRSAYGGPEDEDQFIESWEYEPRIH